MRLRRKTQDALVTATLALREVRVGKVNQNDTKPWEHLDDAVRLLVEDMHKPENHTLFDGAGYNPALDDRRLSKQLGRVFTVMMDGNFHTLDDIVARTGDPQASVSAQLRHLRKAKHGAWILDQEKVGRICAGLHAYRLRNPDGSKLPPLKPRPPLTRGSAP